MARLKKCKVSQRQAWPLDRLSHYLYSRYSHVTKTVDIISDVFVVEKTF